MLQDLRFGLRLVRKHPLPVGLTIAGLALAIGVATTVYSIVNATMLRPYGMDDPPSVVGVGQPGHSATFAYWPYAAFLQMRSVATLMTLEASVLEKARFSAAATHENDALRWIHFVSGGYLQTLGGRPAMGRALVPSDDAPGAPPVVMVSHHFWKAELGGDPSIAGRVVWLNGALVTIVGVLQPGFTGPRDIRPAFWATLGAYDDVMAARPFEPATRSLVEVFGRMTPGTTARAAEEELRAIVAGAGTAASDPHGHNQTRLLTLFSAAAPIDMENPMEAYVATAFLVGILGLVLALACANAANLLLAAAATRAREIGVRLAMGATRGRLIRQLVNESLLLGLLAGGTGFLLAIWLVPILTAVLGISPEVDTAPDGYVVVFSAAIAIVCGLGTGISPARYGARGDVLSALKDQSGWRAVRAAPSRLRTSYVGFQAAVSMLLLVVAALLARSAIQMTRTDAGFDADRILAVSLSAPRKDFDEAAYVQRAVDAVHRARLVERVSVSQYQPFGPSVWRDEITHGGRTYTLYMQQSDAALFVTLGVRVLRGRTFTADEVAREAPVALISDSVARAFFAGSDPVGQSLSMVPSEGSPRAPATIVGVMADAIPSRLGTERHGTIYLPISRQRSNPPSLIVRTANPHAAARGVEESLRRLDARVRVSTSIVGERLEAYLDQKRLFAWLAAPTAILALILAALGVYGVTAFVVSQRTQEVSVRMAIGASAADVLRLLVTQGLRPIAIGVVIGLAAAVVVGRIFASELAGISPYDPLAIGVATTTVLTVALVAVIVPARRAARTDPASVLRQV